MRGNNGAKNAGQKWGAKNGGQNKGQHSMRAVFSLSPLRGLPLKKLKIVKKKREGTK
jgi:hypothetical protein